MVENADVLILPIDFDKNSENSRVYTQKLILFVLNTRIFPDLPGSSLDSLGQNFSGKTRTRVNSDETPSLSKILINYASY